MDIQAIGNSTQSNLTWLDKLAQVLEPEVTFQQGDFSDTQSPTHTIQIKRLGLMKPLPDGVQGTWWVSPDTARKLI